MDVLKLSKDCSAFPGVCVIVLGLMCMSRNRNNDFQWFSQSSAANGSVGSYRIGVYLDGLRLSSRYDSASCQVSTEQIS
jgi:hypothetical protein